MKLLLVFPFLVASAFSANGNEKNVPPWPERWQLKQNAMTLMEDVVPQKPESDAMGKLFNDWGCAIWGKFFGDTQIGALVAVRPDKAKEFDDAYLCLLLWKGGWKFAQWVGKVQWTSGMTEWSPSETENWNWGIKRCLPDAPYYVISSLDVNAISYRDHFSWFCDPKTHSLQPTGWPKDAMPSLSVGTITFRHCENSGYAPTVFEIDQFDGKPGKNLAIYTDKFEGGGQSFITVSMPVPTTGKRITWRIAPQPGNKFEVGHDRRSLCYSPLDGYLEPFREDATVDIQWGERSYPTSPINFLIWRLTGIERNAQMGLWDEDQAENNEQYQTKAAQKPVRTVVVGIPEAVKAFSWPLNPPLQVPEGEKSK